MNAPGLPPFLLALGIGEAEVATVDERGLRRGYARRLKLIDIEADPQAFQALRESLEQAQRWLAWRDRQAAAKPPLDAASAPDAGPSPQPAEAAPVQPPAAPARPAFEAIGEQAFAAFAARVRAGFTSEEAATAALEQALADPRLLNVDVRTFFEWRTACLLANGWQPGHEFLFDPAAKAFGWEEDPTRLGIFGQLGAMLGAAIRERVAFHRRPGTHVGAQKEMLARLRSLVPADPNQLRAEVPILQALVQGFPNWLAIVAPRAGVNERIEMWNRIPPERRAPPPPSPSPAFRPKAETGGLGWIVWIAIMVIGGLGRMIGSSNDYRDMSRSAAQPATIDLRMDEDLERRQAQAEVLLQRVAAQAASAPAPAPARTPPAFLSLQDARTLAEAARTLDRGRSGTHAPAPTYDPSFGQVPGATLDQPGGSR